MDNIKVEILANGRSAKLLEDFVVRFRKETIVVPKGFITDFASIPRAFWSILPPWGRYTRAAVVHDYLYSIQEMSREECDEVFYVLMQRLGVSWWKRKTMYRAVRMFGMFAWNEHLNRMLLEEIDIDE